MALGHSGGLDLPETPVASGDAAWVKLQKLSVPRQKSKGIMALDVGGCQGLRVADFEGFPHLEELDLSRCTWVDQMALQQLPRCQQLRKLTACQCPRLDDAALQGQEEGGPWQGFALRSMDLSGCPLTFRAVAAFGKKFQGIHIITQ